MPQIYFVSADELDCIKIGIMSSANRISSLQTGIPYKLSVLKTFKVNNRKYEKRIHKVFEHLRRSGEWFEKNQQLLDFIYHQDWEQQLLEMEDKLLIPNDGIKSNEIVDDLRVSMSIGFDSGVVERVRRLARKRSFEEDRDLSYLDLMNEAVDQYLEKYSV